MELKRGIDKAVLAAVESIKNLQKVDSKKKSNKLLLFLQIQIQ